MSEWQELTPQQASVQRLNDMIRDTLLLAQQVAGFPYHELANLNRKELDRLHEALYSLKLKALRNRNLR